MSMEMIIPMTISGSLLILLILVIRKVLAYQVPRRMILWLWGAACVLLIFPIKIHLKTAAPVQGVEVFRQTIDRSSQLLSTHQVAVADRLPVSATAQFSFSHLILWGYLGGLLIFGLLIVGSYMKSRQLIREALPVDSERLAFWTETLKVNIPPKVKIYQSDQLKSPIAGGLFVQRIIVPIDFLSSKEEVIQLVLTHELVHIRQRDNLKKMGMLFVVWLHWFNPLVWLMYQAFNCDLEIVCDDLALQDLGRDHTQTYAYALVHWHRPKSDKLTFQHQFSGSPLKERIEMLMNRKKKNRLVTAAAGLLVVAAGLLVVTRYAAASTSSQLGEGKTDNTRTMTTVNSQAQQQRNDVQPGSSANEQNINKSPATEKNDYAFQYLPLYEQQVKANYEESGFGAVMLPYNAPTQEMIDGLNESQAELQEYADSYGLPLDHAAHLVNKKRDELSAGEIALFEQLKDGAAYLEAEEWLVIDHPDFVNHLEQYRVAYTDGTSYRVSFVYDESIGSLVQINNEDYPHNGGYGVEIRWAVNENLEYLYQISRTDYGMEYS